MREIKFRGKRIDDGEFVYGDLIHDAAGVFSALAIPSSVKFFAEHEYDD